MNADAGAAGGAQQLGGAGVRGGVGWARCIGLVMVGVEGMEVVKTASWMGVGGVLMKSQVAALVVLQEDGLGQVFLQREVV